ncbi:S-ribosylhomocysteine lyase [Eubacteriales bacterium OttesenSCG-928-G02]|nr:S-ribosylhomocysteine lyase [Eubacteriales bacterium OttesenSCG-928-G02]
MKQIESFKVNHDILEKGLYLSRIDKNTKTYDLRMKLPNNGDYFTMEQAHTIEHLAATVLRSSKFSDEIVYFGPMGCATGFYLVVFNIPYEALKDLLIKTFDFIAAYEGEIPGATRVECGNYKAHDLENAKILAEDYSKILRQCTEESLKYKE